MRIPVILPVNNNNNRKDDVDATHYPIFHQVEILAIDEIGKLTVPHLLGYHIIIIIMISIININRNC